MVRSREMIANVGIGICIRISTSIITVDVGNKPGARLSFGSGCRLLLTESTHDGFTSVQTYDLLPQHGACQTNPDMTACPQSHSPATQSIKSKL